MDARTLLAKEPWLEDFFGRSNRIRWSDLVSGSAVCAASLQPWLALIEQGVADRGIVLAAHGEDDTLTWYACAARRQDGAALAEQVSSFLGPALVDFDRTQVLAPRTDPERQLVQRFAGGVHAFSAREGVDASAIWRSLTLLAGLLRRRPARPYAPLRPFGAIRAEFEQALVTGDERQARRCVDELRATGQLSAVNERFLHVRLSVALGREAELVNDASAMSLLEDAELPIRVLRDVIEALYAVYLAPLEAGATPEQWARVFRERLRRHERLFRARRGLRAPTVLRAFLLHEIAKDPVGFNSTQVQAIHSALATHPEHRAWSDELLAWASAQRTGGDLATVPAATAEGSSLDYWIAQPPSPAALAALLRCAMDVGTLEAASAALGALRAYPGAVLGQLSPIQWAMRVALEQLVPTPEAPAQVPTDWTEWAHWYIGVTGDEKARAASIADQGAEQWDHAAWLADAGKVRKFIEVLQSHPTHLRPHLATIFGSLRELDVAPTAMANILTQMLMLVTLDAPTPADLPLLAEWVNAIVRLGAGRAQCDEIASALYATWSEVKSLRSVDWALDVVEALTGAPHTPGGDLEVLFSDILGFAVGHRHRLSRVQLHFVGLLAKDFGLEFEPAKTANAAASVAAPATESFAGVSIGIYTLQEAIIPHLRTAINASFRGCSVEFNHDHVATAALEQLARRCSVMVFAWLCSKHQAFYCVQKNRPNDKPLLMPVGKGSASILRALLDHFASAESHTA